MGRLDLASTCQTLLVDFPKEVLPLMSGWGWGEEMRGHEKGREDGTGVGM